ncbi:MAG: cold shock domain-containing protein [Acidobacteria bacterium]|nr:cold shock domain-containing protein [Acidobacteriota bacterium]
MRESSATRVCFIRDTEGGKYFFHQSALRDTRFTDPTEGTTVELYAVNGSKGPRAEVMRLKR